MIVGSQVPSQGAYTSVATYDWREFVQLVTHLSTGTEAPPRELLLEFGRHLFQRFVAGFPVFFENVESAFEFLKGIDSHIHVEVELAPARRTRSSPTSSRSCASGPSRRDSPWSIAG